MSSPLVSILIATKNRQKYAYHTISHILSFDNKNFELIVSDNSDNNDLSILIEPFKSDERLKYKYIEGHISSIHNFRSVLEMSSGDFVCLIGDDDGISHEFFNCVEFANTNKIDCLVGSLSANYRWAATGQSDTLFTKMTDSTLTIDEFNGKITRVNLESSLYELYRNGYTNYLSEKFPKLYHGIVRRELFVKIKSTTGEFLGGLSPDIYSAVSLALMGAKTYHVDYPITIPGVCKVSSSVQEGVSKKHSLDLNTLPHLNGRGLYKWDQRIPEVYSVHSIWADSALAAYKDLNKPDHFDITALSSLCVSLIMTNPKVLEYVTAHLREIKDSTYVRFYSKFAILLMVKFCSIYLKNTFKYRILGRIKISLGLRHLVDIVDLKTIGDASSALNEFCREKGKSIEYEKIS
ncbi:glycosyltransferase family A protein [Vibrio cyclitrophicus]|uniref:glycosyltransferase family A protein n=1 Tax=Vibrio cyclitrophicus TaxID=47951 RepID=UPI000C83498C|nr:glycosyltransferase family A protein [Vibrio cyclitrophicus]PMH74638.1 hypothetical protein BCU59_02405 [Vibrio cyclitrophicus]